MQDTPRVALLELSEFPIRERKVGTYNVLWLPAPIRAAFDRGADLVRVTSVHVITDFGGKTTGEQHSLLFHQDHMNPRDRRRFLMLTRRGGSVRGGRTLAITPRTAKRVLAIEERRFADPVLRMRLGNERAYDRRFRISEQEYHRCFDTAAGYEHAVSAYLKRHPQVRDELCVRLGILGYLIRGPYADLLMQDLLNHLGDEYFAESWTEPGTLIIDNRAVYHARWGGNQPSLQRNFCI